jgi:hypothetical protein
VHATVVPRLILASASPRRLELLSRAGLLPEVHPADLDETRLPDVPPFEYARRLAAQKAHAVASLLESCLAWGDQLRAGDREDYRQEENFHSTSIVSVIVSVRGGARKRAGRYSSSAYR